MSNHRRGFYGRLLCGTAAISLLSAAAARAEDQTTFNIAPQPLSSALNEFATQSKTAVLFTPELTGKTLSPGLTEVADAETALRRMLVGTGLGYRRNGDTFIIMRADDPQGGSAAGDGAGTVEALIVTAQKREEDIQDVPIAISAFTQEALERSQIAGGPDLMTQVPNMTFTKTNFSSYSIQLRGIGTQAISATVDPAVAVAFNNTPFVRNRFFEQEFYDLQRVEVLRGPQGTLYGRNATAGVVNIISAKPAFRYEAKLSGDVSNYNSTRLEGMVNIPLAEDVVALRIAGAWTKRDGYTTNEITGNPIDGRDLWSTRVSLRFSPSDSIDANLIWEHFEEDDDRIRSGKQLCKKDVVTEIGGIGDIPSGSGSGNVGGPQGTFSQGCKPASLYSPDSFQTPNGNMLPFYLPLGAVGLPTSANNDPYVSQVQSRDLRVIESTVDPGYEAESDVVEFQLALDLTDTLSLNSETAWATDFIFSTQDYNRFNTRSGAWQQTGDREGLLVDGIFCDPQIGCADRLVLTDLSTAKSRHFSQEFRLASDFDGPFNFSLGANFLRYDTVEKYYVFINSATLWAATYFNTNQPAPYVSGVTDNSDCMQNFLEEIDLSNSGGVSVTGGLNCVYIETNNIRQLEDLGHNYFLSKNPYKLMSYAAFGEVYYNIAENLKLTAGLRWTVDKKDAPIIPSWILASGGVGYPVLEVVEQEWREPTGRLTLDWKPALSFTDETLLYGSYARGYKAGGANPPPAAVVLNRSTENGVPPASATHPRTFEAEFVDAFELGAKNTLLDGRLTVNAAAFYYDYKGYQLSQIVDRTAITRNFDANIWGLEIESDWRPVENLRLGLKLGFEDTKVADGMKAVDVMDRTAGDPNWILVRPFPVYPSSCIVPKSVVVYQTSAESEPTWHIPGTVGSGNSDGACERAYANGVDPLTNLPYVPNPTVMKNPGGQIVPMDPAGYEGFNPFTAPNFGEGIDKDLSGNELPNAPHMTATLTADYTIPLPSDWLMTLHTDLYYQSEAWTRIFNTEGYDKLKAYTNVNFAAIFTNDAAGWKVMAYVKNVLDRDSITGAFLNSDDTGLTTNVFLTEPRLYGLRVTKEWTGGSLLGSFGSRNPGPRPFTLEIGGQIQRHDAPSEAVRPAFAGEFAPEIDIFGDEQRGDLDWGDGRDVKLTWRPEGTPWIASLGYRIGKTNGIGKARATMETEEVCGLGGYFAAYCPYAAGDSTKYISKTNWAESRTATNEEHQIIDFTVGRDLGIGDLGQSSIAVGLRYARLESTAHVRADGVPDWYIHPGFVIPGYYYPDLYVSTQTVHEGRLTADREFKGVGPVLTWDLSRNLLGNDDTGHLAVDLSATGGVLFGKQNNSTTGTETATYYEFGGPQVHIQGAGVLPAAVVVTPVSISRSDSATVPVLDLSLGLSYTVGGVKAGLGYRWERYFDAIGGTVSDNTYDRTIDGPYFKIAIGFGG